jgi:peptide/nickel transport system substrate-binding protein
MKKYRWQLLILFVTGLVIGILLILEKRGGVGVVGTPQPVEGGVYTEALIGNLQRLNPFLDDSNSVDRDVDNLIYTGLIKFDSYGMAQPDVAKSIGVSQDGLLYNITLRDDVLWHDGLPLTTADVIYTIDLIRQGGGDVTGDQQSLWNSVEATAFDDYNMQLVLPESFAPFMDYLAFKILPEHVFQGMSIEQMVNSSLNLQPIGCGPYKFSEVLTENGVITGVSLKADPDYYAQKAFLQEVVFRYYPDSTSAYQAYLDGYVQGISQVSGDLLNVVLKNDQLNLYTGRLPQLSMVLFNLDNQAVNFLQDKEVRRALYLGINRNKIINEILGGQAIKANSVVLPDTWAYNNSLEMVAYDPQQAALLLKQAGYLVTGEQNPVRKKDDTEMSLILSYPDDPLHDLIAQSIANDWQNLNINVSLEPVPPDMFISGELESHAFDVALVDITFRQSPDPDPFPFWDQGQIAGGQNYSQWKNRVASETLEQARITSDFAERTRLYHNFQAIFADELPALILYTPVYNYAVDGLIQGVTMGPLFDTSDRLDTITTWYLSSRPGITATDIPTQE